MHACLTFSFQVPTSISYHAVHNVSIHLLSNDVKTLFIVQGYKRIGLRCPYRACFLVFSCHSTTILFFLEILELGLRISSQFFHRGYTTMCYFGINSRFFERIQQKDAIHLYSLIVFFIVILFSSQNIRSVL